MSAIRTTVRPHRQLIMLQPVQPLIRPRRQCNGRFFFKFLIRISMKRTLPQRSTVLLVVLIVIFLLSALALILGTIFFNRKTKATTAPPTTTPPLVPMCCSQNPLFSCSTNFECIGRGQCVESNSSTNDGYIICNTCYSQGLIPLPDGSGCYSPSAPSPSPTQPPTRAPIVTLQPRSTLAPNLFMYLPESVAGPARRN